MVFSESQEAVRKLRKCLEWLVVHYQEYYNSRGILKTNTKWNTKAFALLPKEVRHFDFPSTIYNLSLPHLSQFHEWMPKRAQHQLRAPAISPMNECSTNILSEGSSKGNSEEHFIGCQSPCINGKCSAIIWRKFPLVALYSTLTKLLTFYAKIAMHRQANHYSSSLSRSWFYLVAYASPS